jgi:hypothetical protein
MVGRSTFLFFPICKSIKQIVLFIGLGLLSRSEGSQLHISALANYLPQLELVGVNLVPKGGTNTTAL